MALFSDMMDEAGELKNEVARLRKALQKIANLPLEKTETHKRKPEPIVRARRLAIAALGHQ